MVTLAWILPTVGGESSQTIYIGVDHFMPTEFRTLDVAISFTQLFQTTSVPWHLRNQLDRASSSIALNLSEGSAQRTTANRHRYYRMALGALRESETILKISNCKDEKVEELRAKRLSTSSCRYASMPFCLSSTDPTGRARRLLPARHSYHLPQAWCLRRRPYRPQASRLIF